MTRAYFALLASFALLAGCAADPPPVVEPGEPTFRDGPGLPPRDPPSYGWRSLASGGAVLTPTQDAALDVSVPGDALTVTANFTIRSGATQGFALQLGACRWSTAANLVAGQAFAVDCGGLPEGAERLVASTPRGALTVGIEVVALVCASPPGHEPCPAPPPTREG